MINGLGILAVESVNTETPPELLDDEILVRAELQQEIDQVEVESAESALSMTHMKVNTGKIAVKSLESLVELESTDAMRIGLEHNLTLLGLSAESVSAAVNDADLTKKYIGHANEGITEIVAGIYKGVKLLLTKIVALLGSNRAAVSAKIQTLNNIDKENKLGAITWKASGDSETATVKVNDTEITLTAPMMNVSVAEDISKKKIKIADLDNIKSMDILNDAKALIIDSSAFNDLIDRLESEEYFLWHKIQEYDEADVKSRMKKLKEIKDLAKKAVANISKTMGRHSDVYAYSKEGVLSFKNQKTVKMSHNEVSTDEVRKMADVYYESNSFLLNSVEMLRAAVKNIAENNELTSANVKQNAIVVNDIVFVDEIKVIVLEYVAEYNKMMKEISDIIGKQSKLLEGLSRYVKQANDISYKNIVSITDAKIDVVKQAAKKLK